MRRVLILLVCLSIALCAVSGMHAHLERKVEGAAGGAAYAVHVEAEIGAAHEMDHDESGEIDIALLAQLVGSLAALAALWWLRAAGRFTWIPSRPTVVRARVAIAVFAPLIRRLIYYLHPPSHAPPLPAR